MCACEACMSENAHLLHTHTHTCTSLVHPSLIAPTSTVSVWVCGGGGEGGAVGRVQGVG